MSGRGVRKRRVMAAGRRLAWLGVLVALCAPPVHAAGEAAGTTAGSFLTVGAGASVLSMAGATLATGHDLAAAAWNPASLAGVDALQFSLSHVPLAGGATQEWLAAGGRMGGRQTRWALQALFQQEGELDGRDALNNPTGTVSVSDLALGARLAYPLTPGLSAGAGAQWVHESLAGSNGSGVAFDAGLRATSGALGFALAARSVGGGMSYGGTRYDLPGVLAAGASWSDPAHGVRLDADFESPLHYYRDVRVGGEWSWQEHVALRAGYRLELGAPGGDPLTGPTFGFGAGVGGTWLDYAYALDGGSGTGEHRIGLTFRPGLPGQVAARTRTAHAVARREPVRTAAGPASAQANPPVPAASRPAVAAAGSPAPASSAVSRAHAAAPSRRPATVVVAKGETLRSIAQHWHTTVTSLMQENNLVREDVDTGTRLKLPLAADER